jgi:hypothetical protein
MLANYSQFEKISFILSYPVRKCSEPHRIIPYFQCLLIREDFPLACVFHYRKQSIKKS